MNQKYNPMLSLVALVLMALILVFTCTGCTDQTEAAAAETPNRFTETREMLMYGYVYIITDTETGEQYIAYRAHGQGCTLTKLEG